MKVNQLKLGSILSYGQMALGILIGMVYTPVMIRLLGQSEYGLYNTVSSTISLLSVLSLGFNSSYIRYFSQYKHKNDQKGIDRLNGLFLLIFLIIGTVALGCGLYLAFNLEMVFGQGLTAGEYKTARVLMILLSVNLGVSFPMSVFTSIISAHERYVVLKLLAMLKTVAGPLVTLPLLLMGYRSVAMVTVTLAITFGTDLVYLFYTLGKLGCRFEFRSFEKGLFRQLLVFTSFIAINMIVDQVNTNIPKFLLGRYQGTVSVAIYSVGYTLYQYYVMFSTAVSGVFAPRVHNLVQSTAHDPQLQRREITGLFTRVGRIQYAVLALVATGLVFFGRPFLALWAGEGYEDSYVLTLLLVLPSIVPLMQNIGIEVQRALNKHKFRSIAYIFMALFNLGISVWLCQRYGALGAAVGTALSLIIANGLVMNIYYHRQCQVDIVRFWGQILRMSLGMLPAVAVGIAMNCLLELSGAKMMLFGIGAYTLVYCAGMWLFGFNDYEKDLLRKPLRKLLRR